jgi:hypothetical protein
MAERWTPRPRTLFAYVASSLLRAIEVSDLEKRLIALADKEDQDDVTT